MVFIVYTVSKKIKPRARNEPVGPILRKKGAWAGAKFPSSFAMVPKGGLDRMSLGGPRHRPLMRHSRMIVRSAPRTDKTKCSGTPPGDLRDLHLKALPKSRGHFLKSGELDVFGVV